MLLISEMYHVCCISKVVENGRMKLVIAVEPVTCLIHPQHSVVVVLFHVCQPTQLKTVTR